MIEENEQGELLEDPLSSEIEMLEEQSGEEGAEDLQDPAPNAAPAEEATDEVAQEQPDPAVAQLFSEMLHELRTLPTGTLEVVRWANMNRRVRMDATYGSTLIERLAKAFDQLVTELQTLSSRAELVAISRIFMLCEDGGGDAKS